MVLILYIIYKKSVVQFAFEDILKFSNQNNEMYLLRCNRSKVRKANEPLVKQLLNWYLKKKNRALRLLVTDTLGFEE